MAGKQRLKLLLTIVPAIALVIAAGLWLARPRERSLLDKAHRVIGLAKIAEAEIYDWVSEHELITISRYSDSSPKWQYKAALFDTATKTYTPLTGLAKTFTDKELWPTDFKMSPGRTWLYWVNRTDTSRTEFAASRLDGTHYRTWVRYGINELFFTDDGHIAQLASNPSWVAIRDLSDARRDHVFAYPGTKANQILADHAADHPRFVVVETDRHSDDTESAFLSSYRFLDYIPLNANRQYGQPAPVAPDATAIWPANTNLATWDVSLDESRAVFSTRYERPDELLAFIHRIIPSVKVPTKWWESIWVWNGDTTAMKELGRLPGKDLHFKYYRDIECVKWLPSGRQISFQYKQGLYVLKADAAN